MKDTLKTQRIPRFSSSSASEVICCEIPPFRCECALDALAATSPAVAETVRSLRFYRSARAELIFEGESVPTHLIEKITELERGIQLALRREGALAA